MTDKVTIKAMCRDCDGTGIYHGFAEIGDCGVVCTTCKGTGCAYISYTPFEARKPRKGIDWVYEHNNGIAIGKGRKGGEYSDFGGMSYADWLSGKSFDGLEDRAHTCPVWCHQGKGPAEDMKEDYCRKRGMPVCGSFRNCPYFPEMLNCWKRYDAISAVARRF